MKKKKKDGKKSAGERTGKIVAETSNATVMTDGNFWWVEQYEAERRKERR